MKEHDATEIAYKNGYQQGVKDCKAEIDRLTAVEESHREQNGELRKEVDRLKQKKKGVWYRHDKKKHGDTCFYCSACEKMAMTDGYVWELTDFCPYCGAEMERGKDNASL